MRLLTTDERRARLVRRHLLVPDARVSFQDLSQQGFTAQRGFPIEMTIRGPDWGELAKAQDELMDEMRRSDLYRDVDSDYLVGMPEIQILPDRDLASAAGVSMESLAETVSALVGGVRVGTYEDRGRRYDVRVRLLSRQRRVDKDGQILFQLGLADKIVEATRPQRRVARVILGL